MENISEIVQNQREFTKTQPLRSVEVRVNLLKKLKTVIEENSQKIEEALKNDLGKGSFESYISEIDFVIHEINIFIKKLSKWSRPKRVPSSLTFFPVKSYIHYEPYGSVLILAPWNYPFQLLFAPLVGAIGAGNTAILKPSEVSANVSTLVASLINDNFDPRLIKVVEGAVPETTELLNQKFDYIFYTGNGDVGKIILEKAAKHLTPVTLELGGKSPCAVYTDKIDLSAKRIVWGKFFNAAQTCVAPDYVLMEEKNIDKFVAACEKWIKKFYGEKTIHTADYGRIINEKHFDRLVSYLDDSEILLGGDHEKDDLFLSPTVLKSDDNSKVMQEEIFGPILPIISCESLEKAIAKIKNKDKPLAAYAFLDNEVQSDQFITEVSSGGMVINDTIVHLSNENLPFGGVGASGMGSYHGKFSFELFSHKKSVMKRSFKLENNLRYPPYKNKLWLIRKILNMFG